MIVSLAAALDSCQAPNDEVFVIGGAQIYAEALSLAQRLYLTEIHAEFAGDAHFPEFDHGAWRETSREHHHAENGIDFEFVVYDRL